MKNKPQIIDERNQNRMDWLFQEDGGDDFLTGKIPQDLSDTWEEEE